MVSESAQVDLQETTSWKIREGVVFEHLEDGLSVTLSRKDSPFRLEGLVAEEVAEHLETEFVRGPDFFRSAEQVVKRMIEEEEKEPTGKIRVGNVSTFGENGLVWALIYAPMQQGERAAADAVKGTTALVMIRDTGLAESLQDYKTLEGKTSALLQSVGLIREQIKKGEARAIGKCTGWGGTPQSGLSTDALLIEASSQEEKPIKMVVQPAFMGSNHTLRNYENREEKKRVREKMELGAFVDQSEDFWQQYGKWLEAKSDPAETIASTFDTFEGHSMGGYLAIKWAASELPIMKAFKEAGGRVFADKPVIVGTKEKGISEWMREIIQKPEYQKHVLLMSDWLSGLVRLGASDYWQQYGLAPVREAVLELGSKIPILPKVFGHYMNPELMFDGDNIVSSHLYNYVHDPEFHSFCNDLLDNAGPVLTEEEIGKLAGKMEHLYMLFGGKDKTLTHTLGGDLSARLKLPSLHVNAAAGGVHYANVEEIMWMVKRGQFRSESKLN